MTEDTKKRTTTTEYIVSVIQAMKDSFKLDDNNIKKSLKDIELPRSVPHKWGGKFKEKDPNKPKAKCNAFIFYSNENRAKVKEENKDLNNKQVVSKMSEIWKTLTDDNPDKIKCNELANKDRERYEQEMKVYDPNYDSKKKTSNKPKNAYNIYQTEKRDELAAKFPQKSKKDIQVEIRKLWKEITPEQKKVYQDRAEVEKRNFVADIEDLDGDQVVQTDSSAEEPVSVAPPVAALSSVKVEKRKIKKADKEEQKTADKKKSSAKSSKKKAPVDSDDEDSDIIN